MDPQHVRIVAITALATAGIGYTLKDFATEAVEMEGQHWVMVVIVLVVGYVLGRLWTQPAQMLGLP